MNYTLSNRESKIINILKLFSIILVLYIHSFSNIEYLFNNNILFDVVLLIEYVFTQVIARAAVPLFFLISSVLLYRKDFTFKENLKKKVRRILVPYIIANTIWIILFAIFQRIDYFNNFFNNENNNIWSWSLVDWVDAYIPLFNRSKPFVYPLWFLKDLFILNIIAIVLKRIIEKLPKIFFIILTILWLFNIEILIIEIQSLFFFSLGYYIVKYNIRINLNNINKMKFKLSTILYFVCSFSIAFLEILYGQLPIIHNLFIIGSMLYLYLLATKLIFLTENRIGKTLMKYSFFIYLYHEWTLLFVRKILDKVFGNQFIINFFKCLAIPIIIVAICMILANICEKISYKSYKLITGEKDG